MLLHEVVVTTEAVASTSSRLAKIDALAICSGRLEPDEIAPAIGFLTARPRQGRIGVGWRGVATLKAAHADEPSLTVLDVDAALDRLAGASGAGSVGARREELDDLAAPRDGAGVGLRDARDPRRAAHRRPRGRPAGRGRARIGAGLGPTVRRAAMLSGDLGETARIALAGAPGELAEVGLVVGRPVHADARLHGGVGRRGDRDRRGRGIRRIQARRRAHPGASGGRRRAASTRATSPTSRTACPRSSRSSARCRCTT